MLCRPPLPPAPSSSSSFLISSQECDLCWPWPALLGILHTWRDLNRALGPFQKGHFVPVASPIACTHLQLSHQCALCSFPPLHLKWALALQISAFCFCNHHSIRLPSVPSLPLAGSVINCHSSVGLSSFSPFFFLFFAALSFDGYLASELWQSFPPPPSLLPAFSSLDPLRSLLVCGFGVPR